MVKVQGGRLALDPSRLSKLGMALDVGSFFGQNGPFWEPDFERVSWFELSFWMCGRGEGVQGVLTLFCSGAAQVCHDDRVVELKEQLEVEEEDGDRQEEEEEIKGEVESRRVRHG